MLKKDLEKLIEIFKLYSEIKLVYLFGSRANGKVGPLSDYDFAVYLDGKDSKKRFDLRLKLISEVCGALKTDDVDLVIINDIKSPLMKYNIIYDGKIIFEKKPYKILLEPRILSEFFDFDYSLKINNLTKSL
ncbi:nucleotidyltransferase domain-containing protein [Patescibacteria group bacterium]|nr:nucleotidyltransferase domain-containing protein [Patescibacteria group bacterium]